MSTTMISPKTRSANLGKLTVAQRMFCEEMAADPQMDATSAARKAGYKCPGQAAAKLMKNKTVMAYLGKVLHDRMERTRLDADSVLEHLRQALFLDPLDMFKSNGQGVFTVRSLDEVPKEVRRCITKVKSRVRETEDGTETYLELEFMSKDAAMVNVMKHLGLLQPDGGVNVNVNGATIDFDELCRPPDRDDVVEGKIANAGKAT